MQINQLKSKFLLKYSKKKLYFIKKQKFIFVKKYIIRQKINSNIKVKYNILHKCSFNFNYNY